MSDFSRTNNFYEFSVGQFHLKRVAHVRRATIGESDEGLSNHKCN